MSTRWAIITILMLLTLSSGGLVAQTPYVAGGYYPAWRSGVFPPSRLQMNSLTHVIHAFAWPDSDGSIHGYSGVPDPALVVAVKDSLGKITVALGGYGNSGGFPTVAKDPAVRRVFVDTLMKYLVFNGYDGVDIDWEWPQSIAERESLVALVRDVRAAFNAVDTSMIITMAVPTGSWSGQWLNFAALLPYVNWFNAMTYDFHGSWTPHAGHNAPLYAPASDIDGSVDQGIHYLQVTRGIPKEKLLLGLPFYAKEFTASALYAPSSGVTDILYDDVVTRINQGWTYLWDAVSQVPYLKDPSGTRIVTFDDSLSIAIKCQYAKSKQLAGVMIWALGEDLVGQTQPLMRSVSVAMGGTSGVIRTERGGIPSGYGLSQNYPNPFNPKTGIRFQVSAVSDVRLAVYDILGREVALLVNEKKMPGDYEVEFDATVLASGIYIYRLTTAGFTASRTMIVLK